MLPHWRKRVIDALSRQVYDMVVYSNHFLRRVNREIDLSFINELCAPIYKNGTAQGGRPAEEPERVFRALLVMILYGLPFETWLVREIAVNLAFRWFCGLGLLDKVFDHSLLYVVRKRLGPALFEEILTRIFQQCFDKGLVSNEWAFYDVTSIEGAAAPYTPYERAVILARAVMLLLEERPAAAGADPSAPPAQAAPALRRLVAEVVKEVVPAKKSRVESILQGVERLAQAAQADPEHLPHRERVAQTLAKAIDKVPATNAQGLKETMEDMQAVMPHAKGDPDVRVGRTDDQQFFCGYLSGVIVDGKYGLISATHLAAGNAYQADAFMQSAVAAQHVQRAGRPPDKAALDAAFGYVDVANHLAEHWPQTEVFLQPGVIPPLQKGRQHIFQVEAFTLTEGDELLCPNEALPLAQRQMRVQARHRDGTLEYVGRGCAECELRAQCTTKQAGPRVVKMHPQRRRQRQAMENKAKTPEHRAAMKQRLVCIEPVFGHGKSYHHWAKALYRSLQMNRVFNLLVAIAWDIEKLVRYAPLERRRLAVAT